MNACGEACPIHSSGMASCEEERVKGQSHWHVHTVRGKADGRTRELCHAWGGTHASSTTYYYLSDRNRTITISRAVFDAAVEAAGSRAKA